MTETIAEIALRLAREQLAAERDEGPESLSPDQAVPPLADNAQAGAASEVPTSELSALPLGTGLSEEAIPGVPGVQVRSARDAAVDRGSGAAQTTSPNPHGPPLRREGEGLRPAIGFGFDEELGLAHGLPVDEQDFALQSPATRSSDSPTPALRNVEEDSRPAMAFDSEKDPQSVQRAGDDADDRGGQQLVETIGEHGRRLEEVLSELERSLTTLFTTQLETLRQLRDHVQEQERRWVEQTANRRVAYSPP